MIWSVGFFQLLISPLLALLFYPGLIVFIVVNEFIRLCVSFILFLKYHDLIQLVSEGSDAFFGHKKNGGSRNVILNFVTPAGFLTATKVAKFYREHIQSFREGSDRHYEKFERTLTTAYGYVCWKKAHNFNVRNHIRVVGKGNVFSVQDLKNLLSDLSGDMKESKPQWEIIIVPRYDDGNGGDEKSILLLRFSHAYMDGLSAVMMCKERVMPSMKYVIHPTDFKIPTLKKIFLYINTLIFLPFFTYAYSWQRFMRTAWILRPNDETDTRFERRTKFFTWATSKPITNDVIRGIRSETKTSVTNVISTAIAIAARKTLRKERLVDELLMGEVIAWLPYPDTKPQNRVAFFTYPISTREEEPLRKLQQVKKDCLKAMMGPDILGTYYMLKLSGRLPTFLTPLLLHGSQSSVFLSNPPFSRGKVQFPDGTEILEMSGFTPQPTDAGLTITTTHYGDEIKIFSVADSTWLSQDELTKFIDQIPMEILQMAEQLGVKNVHDKNDAKDEEDGLELVTRRHQTQTSTFGDTKCLHLSSAFDNQSPYIR